MSTTDSVFLIIAAIGISLFTFLTSIFIIYIFVTVHRIFKKTEMVIDGVESATNMIKEISEKKALSSIVKLISLVSGISKKE